MTSNAYRLNWLVRYKFSIGLGAVATVLLFLLMQSLIKSDGSPIENSIVGEIVEFVRVEEDDAIERKPRKPEPPLPVKEPPPHMPERVYETVEGGSQGFEIGPVPPVVDPKPIGGSGYADGEYLPIVKVAPGYPDRPRARGIEGYVLLEFVVTKTGAVRDPRVIESQPQGVFDRSALKAVLKFKYKPRVVNGEAIDVAGVRNRIVYKLGD